MKVFRFFLIGLFILVLTACVSKSKYVDLEGDLALTQEQVEAKNREITALEDKRRAHENRIAEMEKELENKRKQLEELDSQLLDKNKSLEEKEIQLQEKDKELQEKERELQEKERELQEKEVVIDEMASTRRSIEASLKDQIAAKQVKLETLEGKLKITFVDKILFNSGSARVNEAGQQSLLSLAETLKQEPDQTIVVEGHTDNVGVGLALQKVFPTNWELSTARATSVVRFLQDEAEIQPERMSAVGYSFYKPVADNETEEGRAQNRRIEIILVPPR